MVRLRLCVWLVAVMGAAVLAFALPADALAQLPPPPHQVFYGADAMLDGAPAPDGATVTATNQAGTPVGSTPISDGSWLLNVATADATTVTFQIDGSEPSRTYAVASGRATAVPLDLRTPVPQVRYKLAEAAGANFAVWRGGVATSAVFEAVAGLRIVWWWSGVRWVSYVPDPAALAIIKPIFALATGDVLYVVADGPVEIMLSAAPAADPSPVTGRYTLVEGAGANFVVWQGGAATSAVFEAVWGLRIVWWWDGAKWVSYVPDPGAPAITKPAFRLASWDVLYVVSDGRVQVTLGADRR